MNPLSNWNPYDLPHRGNAKSTEGRAVFEGPNGKRNGKATPDKAYNGTNSQKYFRTPTEFFLDPEDLDPADTIEKGIHVLDGSGEMRSVKATGFWIHIPEIPGVGKLRQRYPIMPIHEEGSGVWKELAALTDIVLEPSKYKHLFREDIAPKCTEACLVKMKATPAQSQVLIAAPVTTTTTTTSTPTTTTQATKTTSISIAPSSTTQATTPTTIPTAPSSTTRTTTKTVHSTSTSAPVTTTNPTTTRATTTHARTTPTAGTTSSPTRVTTTRQTAPPTTEPLSDRQFVTQEASAQWNRHEHYFTVSQYQMAELHRGNLVSITTEEADGHSHHMSLYKLGTKYLMGHCDCDSKCFDGHGQRVFVVGGGDVG